MRHPPEQREKVLNLWPGHDAAQICDLMAEGGYDITPSQVWNIVVSARQQKDRRAIRKTNAVYA